MDARPVGRCGTPARSTFSSSCVTETVVGTISSISQQWAVGYEVGHLTVLVASLDDTVASKEFAGRDKDRDALPELNELLRRQQSS